MVSGFVPYFMAPHAWAEHHRSGNVWQRVPLPWCRQELEVGRSEVTRILLPRTQVQLGSTL